MIFDGKAKETKELDRLKNDTREAVHSALTLLDGAGNDYRAGRHSEMEAKMRDACAKLFQADDLLG